MDENRNVVKFKNDFIVAGVKTSLKSFYDSITKMGVNPVNRKDDQILLNNRIKSIVILCKNEFALDKHTIICRIQVLSKEWWDFYHNKRKHPSTKVIRTYNLPKQWKTVENLLITKEIPTLIPEEL